MSEISLVSNNFDHKDNNESGFTRDPSIKHKSSQVTGVLSTNKGNNIAISPQPSNKYALSDIFSPDAQVHGLTFNELSANSNNHNPRLNLEQVYDSLIFQNGYSVNNSSTKDTKLSENVNLYTCPLIISDLDILGVQQVDDCSRNSSITQNTSTFQRNSNTTDGMMLLKNVHDSTNNENKTSTKMNSQEEHNDKTSATINNVSKDQSSMNESMFEMNSTNNKDVHNSSAEVELLGCKSSMEILQNTVDYTDFFSLKEDSTKKYKCTYCTKRFSRPSSLKTHTYVHTGERPFPCDYPGCKKRFSVLSNLRRHSRVHNNPKKLLKILERSLSTAYKDEKKKVEMPRTVTNLVNSDHRDDRILRDISNAYLYGNRPVVSPDNMQTLAYTNTIPSITSIMEPQPQTQLQMQLQPLLQLQHQSQIQPQSQPQLQFQPQAQPQAQLQPLLQPHLQPKIMYNDLGLIFSEDQGMNSNQSLPYENQNVAYTRLYPSESHYRNIPAPQMHGFPLGTTFKHVQDLARINNSSHSLNVLPTSLPSDYDNLYDGNNAIQNHRSKRNAINFPEVAMLENLSNQEHDIFNEGVCNTNSGMNTSDTKLDLSKLYPINSSEYLDESAHIDQAFLYPSKSLQF
ncbi:Zinc finger protein [Zancudomyces culisetae]|uniref:Zinc finger protein n=1 Tax=Zancudomyces culisetae TaxID=1213189 RepID=A0A1R1PT22_ZANCU|nr:Zinc finger protein [Zancudomyces culisetae]|eukprot:OMH84101.1 Zinc finger protein [Zancudomyces culisetae]